MTAELKSKTYDYRFRCYGMWYWIKWGKRYSLNCVWWPCAFDIKKRKQYTAQEWFKMQTSFTITSWKLRFYPIPKGLNNTQRHSTAIINTIDNPTSDVHLKEKFELRFWNVTKIRSAADWGLVALLTAISTPEQKRNKNKAKCKKLISKK